MYKEEKKQLFVIALSLSLFVIILLLAVLIEPVEKKSPDNIAILLSGESRRERLTGLKHGLEELGFREHVNVEYDVRSADENRQRLAFLAEKIVQSEPKLIVVLGGLEAEAVLNAQQKLPGSNGPTPVVLAGVASAAARGLYTNGHPLDHLTGVENLDAELSGKRLEYFKLLLPHLKRVGVIYEPGIIPSEQGLAIAQQAAPFMGLEILKYPVRSADDLLALETTLQPGACDGLLLMPSFIIESGLDIFYQLSLNHKLPVFGLRVKGASDYYFASFGPDVYHQGRQTSRLVAKILKQGFSEAIPVETPDRVEFVINVQISQQLGIKLTPEQLQYADRLIEGGDGP